MLRMGQSYKVSRLKRLDIHCVMCQEPARCTRGGVEYCHGEVVRGLAGWPGRLQLCRDGRLAQLPLLPASYNSAMNMFHP